MYITILFYIHTSVHLYTFKKCHQMLQATYKWSTIILWNGNLIEHKKRCTKIYRRRNSITNKVGSRKKRFRFIIINNHESVQHMQMIRWRNYFDLQLRMPKVCLLLVITLLCKFNQNWQSILFKKACSWFIRNIHTILINQNSIKTQTFIFLNSNKNEIMYIKVRQ